MATIQFRAKIKTIYNADDTIAYRRVKVPTITRGHCDMAAFRSHPKFGAYANSDLFPAMLKRAVPHDHIRLDAIPANVTVDASGFLALVSVEV